MQERRKIVAAISGGVDSAVSAARLVGAGHQVVGVFMATHSGPGSKGHMADARRVAEHLSIEFEAMDFTGPMQEIIDLFVQEYSHGRTPNPCIICNARVKFGRLMEFADSIGASGMATGHHVRIVQHQGRPMIGRATYLPKDQSYVLFGLNRAKLGRIEFPVGDLTKSQVRAQARQLDLPVHDKPESQEICFIPNNDYGAFLLSVACG